MRIQKMQLVTGTMLSVLLSAVTVCPAIAQTSTEPVTGEPQSETTTAQTVRGTIRSITGNSVTIETADGKTQVITVRPADLQRLNLQTGTQVEATIDSSSVATNLSVVTDTTATGTNTTGTPGVGTTGTSTTGTTGVGTTDQSEATQSSETTQTTETTETETQPAAQTRPVRALW